MSDCCPLGYLFNYSLQIDEASDAEKRRRKDYKSDSEIYTEPKGGAKKSKTDSKSEKYRKINLDEK